MRRVKVFMLALIAMAGTAMGGLFQSPSAHAVSLASPLVWATCEGASGTPPRECTTIDVPLDYNNASRGTAQLQLARIKASNPDLATHQGTLFFVPGGPPSAGVDYSKSPKT